MQVKGVPAETHAVLRRRAAAAGKSLQEYLRERVIEEAASPTVAEVMERAGGRFPSPRRWSPYQRTMIVVDARTMPRQD